MRQRGHLFLAGAVFTLIFPVLVSAYQAAPVAITREVSFVTEKSAKLGGRVNANEAPDAKQWFEWGLSGQSGVVYETQHNSIWGTQLADTNADIIGLAPSTQYFYRQVAENGRGRDVGQTVYFTTKPLPAQINPIVLVQTNDAVLVTDGGATLKGYLSPHGNSTTKWWFQWGESSKFENETNHSGFGADSGPVTVTLNTLTPGTLYYYRLVAEDSAGRVYGGTKVFITPGTAPQKSEAPRAQNIPTPQTGGDGVTRNTTNSGASTAQATGNTGNALPSAFSSGGNMPGDIFGAFFGKKSGSGTATNSGTQSSTTLPSSNTQATTQSNTAATAASGPLGTFWNTLTGKKGVELIIEKVGPTNIPVHTPVEYRIRYSYALNESANNAKLKIILPAQVVYIGDSTSNELLLEESAGPEHTYVLPLGKLEKGSTRTVSILGMTTGDANGFPDARARIEYNLASGGVQIVSAQSGIVSQSSEASTGAAPAGGSDIGWLPSSLLGWLFYIAFVAGFIFALRKAKAYYDKRKEEIALEEEEAARRAQLNAGLSGPRVV